MNLNALLNKLLRRLRESMPAFKRRSAAARKGWAKRKSIESDDDGPTEQQIERMMEPQSPTKIFDEHNAP